MARDREQKYKLVFREEFNLPDGSQPNPKLWSRVPRANNLWAKWNSDTADVVFIRNGRLVCRVIPNTPFDSLYPHYLCAMTDAALGENDRYAGEQAQYNSILAELAAWLRRKNLPTRGCSWRW